MLVAVAGGMEKNRACSHRSRGGRRHIRRGMLGAQLHIIIYVLEFSGAIWKLYVNYTTPIVYFFQDGCTALSLAAEKGYTRICERLVAAEADICVVDKVRESESIVDASL